MRRLIGTVVASLAVALVASCASALRDPVPGSDPAATVYDPDVLAVLADGPAEADRLARRARPLGYRLIEWTALDGLGFILVLFAVPERTDSRSGIRELERLAAGVTAGVIHRYDREAPVERVLAPAAAPRLYADALIGWPAASCPMFGRVGMIDGGVDAGSFPGADLRQRDFAESVPSDAARRHATAVAEILVGGRPSAPVLFAASVVRADQVQQDGASVTAIVRALDWMVANEVDVVNISLAGPYNRLLDRAVRRALERDVVIVAAVGNDGPDAPPRYPAAFAGVIAATAVDAAKRVYPQAVQGGHVDVAAPGVDVFVAFDDVGRYLTGTSIAAPFVTAFLASDPWLADGISRTARAGTLLATEVADLGAAGRDPVFGLGLIQAQGACAGG
jgi:subtilisin family serine protease